MPSTKRQRPPPRNAASDLHKEQLPGQVDTFHTKTDAPVQRLPSRATLKRRFPRLRLNRLTLKWLDEASGAKGDDIESLRVFLSGGAR